MTAQNTYGRQVVVPLTNKSGGAVAAGDVVIVDTTNNDAFTTTTSGAFTGGIGIAQETIANNATGRVLLSGYAALVNVNASVTRGNYVKTYTVAKQGTDAGSSRVAGTFGVFLTGGTTPDAIIWQPDLGAGSGLVDPMTTRGDVIVRNASNVTARLAIGAADKVLGSDGTDVAWITSAGIAQIARVVRTAGDVAIASTTFTDATGLTSTITTGAHRVLLIFNCVSLVNTAGNNHRIDFVIDGTRVGETYGSWFQGTGRYIGCQMTYLTDVLSAGSHTFKIQHSADAGTGTIVASTALTPAILTVIETRLTA